MRLPMHRQARHRPHLTTLLRPRPANSVRRRPPPTVEFFAPVIWQESRFGAQTVSQEGAEGIAQFMPATASRHGLADPFGRKLVAAPLSSAFEQFRTSREVSK
jgi:hypothetical protein